MMNDLIDLLHKGRHSLVVANGEVCTFNGRGVIDLYHLIGDIDNYDSLKISLPRIETGTEYI